jgi:hypothetical protein
MFSGVRLTPSRLSLNPLLGIFLAVTVCAPFSAAQKFATPKSVARAPDGHPDLQGVWMNMIATPFERPKELAGHPTLTDAEVVEMNRRAKKIFANPVSDAASSDEYFMSAWRNVDKYISQGATDSAERVAELVIDNRTSLITDPPDGHVPALTDAGRARRAAYGAARGGRSKPVDATQVAPGDRCITFTVPRLNGVYAAGLYGYYQILQTKDYVVLFSESIHDARIIPLDGKPLPPENVRAWSGYSRGHWEKDTLVVETANFLDQLNQFGYSPNLRLTEKFTRVAPDEIDYEMTFNDPDTWVRPWSAMVRLKSSDEQLHEFACHEGNEAIMKTILSGK